MQDSGEIGALDKPLQTPTPAIELNQAYVDSQENNGETPMDQINAINSGTIEEQDKIEDYSEDEEPFPVFRPTKIKS